jgi:hypothetical protein
MGLLDRFEEMIEAQRPVRVCAYMNMYESLSDKERQALDTAILKGYSQNLIIKALRAEGYKCSADTMRSHFKGFCKCPPK